MSLSLAFWIVFLIGVIFGVWSNWPAAGSYRPLGGALLFLVLLFILGLKVFGPPIHS